MTVNRGVSMTEIGMTWLQAQASTRAAPLGVNGALVRRFISVGGVPSGVCCIVKRRRCWRWRYREMTSCYRSINRHRDQAAHQRRHETDKGKPAKHQSVSVL